MFANRSKLAVAVASLFAALPASFALASSNVDASGAANAANGRSRICLNDPGQQRHPNDPFTLRILGLTADQRLVCFGDRAPEFAVTIGAISGLVGADTALVGIDFRVQDGNLYGVGNGGGVYRIDGTSGAATFVNALTVALSGSSFGVDFNPAADRLRVISDTGQNLRHNVNAGGTTVNDTALTNAGAAALGVTGAAYTNNDLSASTATTLYDIDAALNQVSIQSPANNGTLAATGMLGFDASSSVGFDIYSTVRDGATVDVEGYAVLTAVADGVTRLYEINLPTGRATERGGFAPGNAPIDIAIPLDQR
jgi:hypothetical protein